MSNMMSFIDKNFSEASSPRINPKNNYNSILKNNTKSKENFDMGATIHVNVSEQGSSILS
jgi:hypothetical protein